MMMRFFCFLLILFMQIANTGLLIAQSDSGLYDRLNGVYLAVSDLQEYSNFINLKRKSFSWGLGLCDDDFTPVIDLGDSGLLFGTINCAAKLTGVSALSKDSYALHLVDDFMTHEEGVIVMTFVESDIVVFSLPENTQDDTFVFYSLNKTAPENKNIKLVRYKKISGPGIPFDEKVMQ